MRLLLLSFFFSLTVFGQNPQTKTFIETLCSPSFHGRGYVNHGDSIAANYIAKSFQEIGLLPEAIFRNLIFRFKPFLEPAN
jgi:hypothetical protein